MTINIYYCLLLSHQIYNNFNVLENQDTPNIVKEKIVTKVTDNSTTGIYLFIFYMSYLIIYILMLLSVFYVIFWIISEMSWILFNSMLGNKIIWSLLYKN